jgi:hypothetical protein
MTSHDAAERPNTYADEEKMAPSNSSTLSPEFPDQPLTAPEDGTTNEVLEKQAEAVLVKPNVHDMSSVPNGGVEAWLQVLGGKHSACVPY